MRAITDEVVNFQMPGSVIPGFARKAVQMAKAGIYDLRIHHDDVVQPVLRFWKVFERDGFGPDGEQAREQIDGFLKMVDERATHYEEKAKARESVSA
jgi:acyl-[acyl-carrier-protein] desaturase